MTGLARRRTRKRIAVAALARFADTDPDTFDELTGAGELRPDMVELADQAVAEEAPVS